MNEVTPAASAEALLAVDDLRVSFRTARGTVMAVDGVSFRLGYREILGIVGESGSGKSVSLMAMMGLINDPNAIVEGSIKFQGQIFMSPSGAGVAARGHSTDGWSFWHYERAPGDWVPLKELRKHGRHG